MRELFKNLNLLPAFFLCVYPVLLIISTILFLFNYEFNGTYLILAIGTYYIANISVGIGLHRLWSHGAYKTKPWVEYLLAFISAGTLQGPILAWASDHFKHHTYTDEELDPHTPMKYHGGLKGFLWSHLGWMIVGESTYKHIDRITMKKLGTSPAVMWQYRNYGVLAIILNLVLPLLIGFGVFRSIEGMIGTFLFMGLGRALQQQATFCVNSLCHFVGKRTYYAGTARDIWWMFMFLLGENWHNFHHAFARDYRNGVKWYQVDIHKWIIAGMERLGLAWDLVRTSEARIAAKVNETESSFITFYQEKIEVAFARANEIAANARKSLEQYETMAYDRAAQAKIRADKKLKELEVMAKQQIFNLKELMSSYDELREDTIRSINKRLSSLEKAAAKLGVVS